MGIDVTGEEPRNSRKMFPLKTRAVGRDDGERFFAMMGGQGGSADAAAPQD